ncbi:hypothetical protein SO694_00204011 [Aureococcus anophagefferens]|uniref:PKD/REJ-like domain-containing protein n=1 Tax=Aureococcus anophagefferens TaxID=44056 RepID=A0ABR1FNS3_AURAN
MRAPSTGSGATTSRSSRARSSPGPRARSRSDAAAGGAVGGASVTIYASRPPSSGVVEAAPPRGVALETRFELRTSSWASEDPPLTYAAFALRASSGVCMTVVAAAPGADAGLVASLVDAVAGVAAAVDADGELVEQTAAALVAVAANGSALGAASASAALGAAARTARRVARFGRHVARFGLAKPSRARRLAAAGRFSLTFYGAAPANATGGNATCAPGADDVSWACGGNLTLTAPCLPGAVVAFFCPFDEAACVAWNGTAWDAACDAAVDGAAVTCDCPAAPAPADYAVTARSVLGTYAYAFAAAPGAAIAATPLLYWTLAALVGACAAVAAVGVVLDARDEARLDDDAWRRAYERSRERGATLGEIVEASMPSFVGRLRGGALRWALELVRSHHSWCRILTHFARDAPRHRRILKFGQDHQNQWLNSTHVGFCERAEHRDDCLAKRTFFAEMVGALAGDGDPDRDACVWSDAPRRGEDRCALRAPEPHDVGFKRLFLIFLGVVLAIPFTELFDATFVRYVCAPVAWTRAAREAPEKRRASRTASVHGGELKGKLVVTPGKTAAKHHHAVFGEFETSGHDEDAAAARAARARDRHAAARTRASSRTTVAAHYAEIARRVDDRRKAAALVVAASAACLAAFAGPVYFLLVFAAAEGRKMTRAWYFSTLFFIFIAAGIVEPFTPAALLPDDVASCFGALGADAPARLAARDALRRGPRAWRRSRRRSRSLAAVGAVARGAVEKALLDEAAAGFARVDAAADADRDGERRAHEAFAALGGAWEVAALERQAKRAKFAAPLYHGAAMAAAAAVLAVHPALRSCVIKQGMILVSLGICGSRGVAVLRAFLDADARRRALGPSRSPGPRWSPRASRPSRSSSASCRARSRGVARARAPRLDRAAAARRVAALVDAHHFGWAGVAGTALSSALLYADAADGDSDVEVAAAAARRGSKAYATLLTSAKGQAAKAVNELRGSVFS